MPERKHRYLESIVLKILGVLILCISGIAISVCLLTREGTDHLSRENFQFRQNMELSQQLSRESQDIFLNYLNREKKDAEILSRYYTHGNTNVRIRVDVWEKGQPEETLVNTFHNDAYGNSLQQYYGFGENGTPHYYEADLDRARGDLESGNVHVVYGVKLWLLEPLRVHDSYYERVRYFQFASAIQPYSSACVLIGIFAFLTALIYELYSAGHRKGKDEIVLTGMDYIPLDVSFVICLVIEAMIASIYMGMDMNAEFSISSISGIVGTLLLMSLVFFFWLMSLARRIKAHTWIENNITTRLLKRLDLLLFGVDEKRVFIFLVLGYFLYQLALINRAVTSGSKTYLLLCCITIGICLYVLHQKGMQETVSKAIHALKDGNTEYMIPEKIVKSMRGSMRNTAMDINELGVGMKIAIEKQMKSERLKAELITNVGHDIKTPLTSIISYVDLLDKLPSSQEQAQYIEVLKRQTERLKKLTEDVLEASKASSGNVEMHLSSVSLAEVVEQSLAEYTDKLESVNLEVRVNVVDVPNVYADGRLLWRVLRNLLSNIAKYAMPGSRVYIDASKINDSMILLTVKNTSKDPLNVSSAELMERFVRGDTARHSEGSGLGLNIAQSLVEMMHGKFELRIDGDLFKVMILLPKAVQAKEEIIEEGF